MKKNILPERKSVSSGETWDLTPLYRDAAAWEDDLEQLEGLAAAFNQYGGELSESPETLRAAFAASFALSRTLSKLFTYAHLKSDEDVADSENKSRLERISAKAAAIQGSTAWFEPEMMAMEVERFDELRNNPALADYQRQIDEINRSRPHVLSAAEERILGLSADVMSRSADTFSALNNADLRFGSIKDANGVETEVTHGNFIKLLRQPDRRVRRDAFNALYAEFVKHRHTMASLLGGTVKSHILNAELRGFDSALAAALHPDNVSCSVYENLIETVKSRLPDLHRYYDLKRRRMGLDELDAYDIHTPLVPKADASHSWEEAGSLVVNAMAPLGEEYQAKSRTAFESRWIDFRESRGKRSGAYSSGCYDSPAYILMNYHGTMNDVFTLAHELGHSMHSEYSKSAQPFHLHRYRIFVAEVASTANELLLFHHLMEKTESPRGRAALLNHLADDIRSVVHRQTMFAEFERHIHGETAAGRPLTADSLDAAYGELNAAFHGAAVARTPMIEAEWSRIPHFHYNFYVYKYATGFSAAASLVKGIMSGEREKLDAYIGFLSAGDSRDVLDILRDAGVDLESPAPVSDTLDLFADTINKIELLI